MLNVINEGKVIKNHQNDVFNPDAKKIIDCVRSAMPSRIRISDVAAELGVSINTLERTFKGTMKITLSDYVMQLRLSAAHDMLLKGATVQEASDFSGFSSCSRFISAFKKVYGQTPLQYKKQY